MSDTPRTDAATYETYSEGGYGGELAVPTEIAKMLERELSAMTAEVEILQNNVESLERDKATISAAFNSANDKCAELRRVLSKVRNFTPNWTWKAIDAAMEKPGDWIEP